jgi:hypothetical protein
MSSVVVIQINRAKVNGFDIGFEVRDVCPYPDPKSKAWIGCKSQPSADSSLERRACRTSEGCGSLFIRDANSQDNIAYLLTENLHN